MLKGQNKDTDTFGILSQKPSDSEGFCFILCFVLLLVYVCSIRPFGALSNIESNQVTFPKIVELSVFEFVGVEKEIFIHAFSGDETISSVSKPSYFSFFHGV